MSQQQSATHAAVLELKSEREVAQEAYHFLDEKRLSLAAELMRQLKRYEQLQKSMETTSRQARKALAKALQRHGLDGLLVYPPANGLFAELNQQHSNLMGVSLLETQLIAADEGQPVHQQPCNPSTEAEQCTQVFKQLLEQAAVLAGIGGNLQRLIKEYRKTERRAKALENIILPEIDQTLHQMTDHLEELDMEDVMRVRQLKSI